MKIAVFGGTGQTGTLVIQHALAEGNDVVALVRNPNNTMLPSHPRLTVLTGMPTLASDVEACVQGADAVVHCLGIGGLGDGKPTTLVSEAVKATLAAMEKHKVKRIVCMSNLGVGGSGSWIVRRLLPTLVRKLRPILDDKVRMEEALRTSGVDWVAVRMSTIVRGPEKPVRISGDGTGIGMTVTAASAARFLLAQCKKPDFCRQTPSISN